MIARFMIPGLAATLLTALTSDSANALQATPVGAVRDGRIPLARGSLYYREVGRGLPIVVLHGGPDFDHAYLLPDLDRLADSFRLIYYDQRGRGRSADGVRPEDVSLASDLADLGRVMDHFGLRSAVVLGHSWGTVLALEYALRHPSRVTRLILMNPAPASASDVAMLQQVQRRTLGADMDRQQAIIASPAYQEGDPETVAARYRIHFQAALARAGDYEKLMRAMRAAFIAQGKEGIVKARASEDRVLADTWQRPGYDLTPRLRGLEIPTLVLFGDHDFIPAEIARHIADAIPGARLVTLADCGHFRYLECPDQVRPAIDDFLGAAPRPRRP